MSKGLKNTLAIIVIAIMCAWIYNTMQQVDKISSVTPEMKAANTAELEKEKAEAEAIKDNPLLATQYVYDVRFEHPYGVAGRLTKYAELNQDLDNCQLVLTNPRSGDKSRTDLRNIIRIGDTHFSGWHTNVLTNKGEWLVMSWFSTGDSIEYSRRIVACNRNVVIG